MTIPADWLICPITPAEVEEDLAVSGAPDFWLRCWRALLDRMAPGDELWVYQASEFAVMVEETSHNLGGFEQVQNLETLIEMGLAETYERISCYYKGIAIVRDEMVIDWIRAPDNLAI